MVGVLVALVAVVTMVGYYQITAALATAEAALQQETEFRRALLETPDFKRREELVVDVAKDPAFLKLLNETINETKDLRDKLNDPRLAPEDPLALKLKSDLQLHAARKELQQRLKELHKAHDQAEPIHNWFVLDSKGLLLAREPARPSFIGDNFAWRTYFHGGTRDYRDLRDYLNNAGGEHVSKPHLPAALESQHTGQSLWAVSAPVFGEKGEFIGVVGLRVKIGQAPDASPVSP